MFLHSMIRLLFSVNLILSSETSILTRATRRQIPQEDIFRLTSALTALEHRDVKRKLEYERDQILWGRWTNSTSGSYDVFCHVGYNRI
jgi:hypothetical protein